jgi:hypothetical protein
MGVINTGNYAKALWPGLNAIYGQRYNEWPVEFTDLFDETKSTKAYEEDLGSSGFSLPQEVTEGGKTPFDESRQTFISRYLNKTYRLGFVVTMEAMEDNQYSEIEALGGKKSQALAFSMRQGKEVLAANIYNRAFTSGYTFGDGTILCNASHPLFSGGTFSNTPAVAADLSEAALEQAIIDIASFPNDRGLTISILPKTLHIPKELMFEAYRILESILQSDSANNNINALKAMGLFPGGAKVNHYFTDADAWFIRTNCPEGMKYMNRSETKFGMDNDSDTFNAKFYSYFRCSFGNTDPRGIYGCQGA